VGTSSSIRPVGARSDSKGKPGRAKHQIQEGLHSALQEEESSTLVTRSSQWLWRCGSLLPLTYNGEGNDAGPLSSTTQTARTLNGKTRLGDRRRGRCRSRRAKPLSRRSRENPHTSISPPAAEKKELGLLSERGVGQRTCWATSF